MMKITDLLDGYDGALPEFRAKAAASPDVIFETTMGEIRSGDQTAPAPCKAPRKISRTVLIAAAVAAALLISALAASGYSFAELPSGVRRWLGLTDEPVPGYVTYDTVNIADNARTADVDHDGDGEMYASSGVTVRSENFVMVYVFVSTVTREQYENYTWRAQIDGTDDWLVAEPDFDSGESSYHEVWGGRLQLRISFILDPEETDTLHVTLYGGTESGDGKTFNVERIGIFSVDTGVVSETVTVTFGDGIPFTNSVTGAPGTITDVEISSERIIWYYHADGSCDLYDITYGDRRDTLQDGEWPALNKELMGWINGLDKVIRNAGLSFAEGIYPYPLIGESNGFFEGDTGMQMRDFREPIDIYALESITVGGEIYPIG
ncbi:MAG: hypothetical protein EOM54_04820 [Clostridia bacterium]|nr:hypothetical protein [Clostridia bacterium]